MTSPLLVALLLASNASGKTMVRTQQGTTVPQASISRPVFLDDAQTVVHLVWNGTSLIDRFGNAWTMNGTVPQVTKSPPTPAGAGPYTETDHYSLGTGSDVLDFTGDFSACLIVSGPTVSGNSMFLDNSYVGGSTGYLAYESADRKMHVNIRSAGDHDFASGSASVAGVNCVCLGRAGTTGYLKLNLQSIVTASVGTPAAATNVPARIGRYSLGGATSFPGIVYEAWFSSSTPSDAAFTATCQSAKDRMGVTTW